MQPGKHDSATIQLSPGVYLLASRDTDDQTHTAALSNGVLKLPQAEEKADTVGRTIQPEQLADRVVDHSNVIYVPGVAQSEQVGCQTDAPQQ